MLGFEYPSHMVTHPSTDEAQCCLTLERISHLANLNPITFKLRLINQMISKQKFQITFTSLPKYTTYLHIHAIVL